MNEGAKVYWINNFMPKQSLEMAEKILAGIDGQSKVEFIANAVGATAINQYAVLSMLLSLAANRAAGDDDEVNPGIVSRVSRTIINDLGRKISQYGQNAYPLSEKQVMITVNDLWLEVETSGKISREIVQI